ncbi:molybdopterin molybdotransferase MoeA [Lichenihabitans sp. PAMC28606]|uniref:molybdopterin molybdotransferase MoeA n=1 Tax=Lichenihabitans sp. PAMC28606 TaxID=2880932 RepID=UPI001D09FD46|nr:gephyrin-like molybdotransferase Glp [Lichenihabitans sp. PAMC28606]UDL93454.1 molybdopterin molybdotransferase MoeA [Lichenihabitans sp. PAMC28606]
MAQLANDCFAYSGESLTVSEARALIGDRMSPATGMETIALGLADGRILAADVVASLDVPPFDNAAVDGYAVRFADLDPDTTTPLRLLGRQAAGGPAVRLDGARGAVRIFTGAPVPEGFDTIAMQEDVAFEQGEVTISSGLQKGANRRLAGEDMAYGATVLTAGRRLGPAEIALMAALGKPDVTVRRRLRVALFSTGDEVVPPGVALRRGQVYDANRAMLLALLVRCGADVHDLGILPDRRDAVAAALHEAAASHDLLITSGGVSAGEEDHVRAAVAEAGSLIFWRLALKPGRPLAMGVVKGVPFIGLPGNPVAAFVTFTQVGRVALACLSGESRDPALPFEVRAGFSHRKPGGRRDYLRARLRLGPFGLEAVKHPADGSGIITSLTETDGFVELHETTLAVEVGDRVGFLPYTALF